MPLVEEVWKDGKRGLRYNLHPGQQRAWDSQKRIVAVIAGVRAGKSSFGSLWLHREMQARGPGDYLVVTPTFPLLDNAARPEIEALFGRLLRLGTGTQRMFQITEDGHKRLWPDTPYVRPSRIVYGHAGNPESLAALTAKAAWLDEAGQKQFRLGSWEEIRRRVSFDEGRVLITTTVYQLGWLKQQVYDPWEQASRNHELIDVVNFRSIDNPGFPAQEYYEAMRTLPTWKFLMFHDGKFTRPAGLIYDCFDPIRHVRPRHRISEDWPRFVGMDFGAVNTAAVYLAEERDPTTRVPTGRYIAYREYPDRVHLPGKLAAESHAVRLLEGEPMIPLFVGGSHSEDDWREKFRAAGIPVMEPPVPSIEVQIDAVYRMIADGRLLVMDDLVGLLDQLASYSRELDDAGDPTEKIENDAAFHLCFVAGTKIATPDGEVNVEDILPGDLVLTRQGPKRVTHCSARHAPRLMRVETSDCISLVGTPDHPIWVKDFGFVNLDSLRYGDILQTLKDYPESQEQTTCQRGIHQSSERSFGLTGSYGTAIQNRSEGPTRGISRAGVLTSTASFGSITTALYRKSITSTTRMKTLSTTTSRTSKWSHMESISVTIWPENQRRRLLRSSRRCRNYKGELKPIEIRKLVASLCGSEPSGRLPSASEKRSRASGVANPTSLKCQNGLIDSAHSTAERRLAEILESMTSSETAANALACSEQTDIPRQGSVTSVVLLQPAGSGVVYNLRVEGPHEYFANGVLVSNCASLRYICSHLDRGNLSNWKATRESTPLVNPAPAGVFVENPDEDSSNERSRISGGSYTDRFPTW